MGWKLSRDAYEQALAGVVSDRARLVLDHMCRCALDAPAPGQASAEYWGGHVAVAACLVGIEAAGTPAGKRAAQRAITELIDAGLIEQVRAGHGRIRAAYRILVGDRWKPALPVDNSEL